MGFGEAGLTTTEFDRGGSNADEARAMVQDGVGGFVMAGLVDTGDGVCVGIARYLPDGTRDPQFHDAINDEENGLVCHGNLLGDMVPINYVDDLSLAVGPSNHIYLAGSFFEGNIFKFRFYVCRLLPDGTFDRCVRPATSVDPGDAATHPSILVYGDELLLVVNPNTTDGAPPELHRLSLEDLSGLPPYKLVEGPIANAVARSADITDEGDLVFAGQALFPVSLGYDFFVARFDLDSNTPDSSFGFQGVRSIPFDKGGANDDRAFAVSALPGGDVLVAGTVQLPTQNKTAVGISRLDSIGEYVQSFNTGDTVTLYANFDATIDVAGVGQTESGRIVVAGTMNFSGAVIGSFISRLLENGAPDASFDEDGLAFHDMSQNRDELTCGLALQGERIVLGSSIDFGAGNYNFALFRLSDGRLFNDGFE